MEKKKEMSFIEKFEAAGNELEKEKDGKCHMLMCAVDDESEKICAVIDGERHKLSALLAYAAMRDRNFKEILTKAIKAVELQEQKNI